MSEPALTAEETAMAAVFGMTEDDYANFKSRRPKLPDPADAEQDRLRQVVRDVLAEGRDA